MFLAVAVRGPARRRRRRLVSVRGLLVRPHGRRRPGRQLVRARSVRRSVPVSVSSVAVCCVPVAVGAMSVVPGVAGLTADVSGVRQGLHVGWSIAESDSRGG